MPRQFLTIVFLTLTMSLLESTVRAQRPPYAGSRPLGTQKDKYRPGVAAGGSVDVANRFGEPDNITTNTIAFGEPQRPPLGWSVVAPESSYVPLATTAPPFILVNRFGDVAPAAGGATTTATVAGTATGIATATATAGATAGNTAQRVPLPLDAHGDALLIDQLSRVPEDKRPFWFLNYQAIEAHRNGSGSNFAGAVASRGSFFG